MASMDPYISSVDLWPLSWAPMQWTICNGQLLSIIQFQPLFALIGATYGGDGQTNFAVPDMRGRVPVGVGQSQVSSHYYNLAEKGGQETITLTTGNMPVHNHPATGSVTPQAGAGKITLTNAPANNFPGETPAATPVYTSTANTSMGSSPVTINVGASGNSQAFSVMQPYLCLNYMIAVEGIFPTRP